MKAMSPSSMTMPTMSTWDSMYQQNGPPSHGPPPPRPPTGPGTLQPPPHSQHNQQQRPPSTHGKLTQFSCIGFILYFTQIHCYTLYWLIFLYFTGGTPNPSYNSYDHQNGVGPGGPPTPNFLSAASDFLSPLSQMSDSLGGANMDKSVNNNSPMGQNPGTPQATDVNSSHPLRHPDTPHNPGTPHSAGPSSGNAPQTPVTSGTATTPLSHGGAGAASTTPGSNGAAPQQSTGGNGGSNNTPSSSATPTNTTNTSSTDTNNAANSLLQNNDLPSDLNFDPAAIINGDETGQEGLDVSCYNVHP